MRDDGTLDGRARSDRGVPWHPWAAWCAALMLGVGLPLALSWQTAATFFTPKLGLLYMAAALGVLGSVGLSLKGGSGGGDVQSALRVRLNAAELAAIAFLCWGLISTLLAASPWVAVFGTYNQGTGWLFWGACMAVWSAFRRGLIGLQRR